MLSVSTMYVGVVPPPEIVQAYEQYAPGAAERFLRIAEREQDRRIKAEEQEQQLLKLQEENETANFRKGLSASMQLMVMMFGFMFFCAWLRLEGPLVAALGVPLLGAIGSIVAQFIWRKKRT